jgi:uncharacterized protein YraI
VSEIPTPRRPASRVSRAAALAATTLALFGGALTLAPTASAVGSSGCNSAWYDFDGHISANGVNLRSGPGTSYSIKGVVSKGTTTVFYCYRDYGAGKWSWDYLKITSGPNKGVSGWVRSDLDNWF